MTTTENAAGDPLVEVTVVGIDTQVGPRRFTAEPLQADMSRNLILFRERDGDRRLQVLIGQPEAVAIASALQGQATQRPMTHDALKQSIDILSGHVVQVVLVTVGRRRRSPRTSWWPFPMPANAIWTGGFPMRWPLP